MTEHEARAVGSKGHSSDLLILRFSSLGDVLLATVAATRLKRGLKGRRVVFVTRAAWAPLLYQHPDIDQVLLLDDGPGGGAAALLQRLRTGSWEGILDLHGSLRSRWLAARLPARARVRYRSRGLARRLLVLAPGLTRRLGLARPWQVAEASAEAADQLVRRLGGLVALGPALPMVHLTPAERAWAERRLADLGLEAHSVGLCPGARHATKRWPVEYYAALIEQLVRSGQARTPVFLGPDPDDQETELALRAALRHPEQIVVIREPLRQAAALLQSCRTLVTNDSGLMHLAAALGRPVVALFGPTVAEFGFRPAGPGHRIFERALGCRPCSLHGTARCPRGHHRCLRDLTPEEIWAGVEAIDLARSMK